MATATLMLSPNLLAFWVKALRTASNWSQEALAASANVNVRTVQRVETGQPTTITTRRALARGFGYDNVDIFDDPTFIQTVQGMIADARKADKETLAEQFPDHVPVPVLIVESGSELARMVDEAGATLLHCDDEAPQEAQELAAGMFDLMQDLVDVWDDISFTERRRYREELERLKNELESFDLRLFWALRSTKMVGTNWADKSPMPIKIGYLTIVPKHRELREILAPKQLM